MKKYSRSGQAVIALAMALSVLIFTGCTNTLGSSDTNHNGMMGEESPSSEYSAADIMFAQMMIAHHQQAVDMATLAKTRASHSEVKALAAQIEAEQAPEIERMTSWLKAAGAPLEFGHSMHMQGLLTEGDMAALSQASGAEFDKLFLEGMIGHHEGAILMAQPVIDSNNSEVKSLAEAVVSSQTEQIVFMKKLLTGK